MITKERLEELLGQGATIYSIDFNRLLNIEVTPDTDIKKIVVDKLILDSDMFIKEDKLWKYYWCISLENLFETEEDAEFALRFKRIPRTEYLDLPTWGEFCALDNSVPNFRVSFMSKYKENYGLYLFNNLDGSKNIILYNFDNMGDACVFDKPANEENYIEACRLVKKLFETEDEEEKE